MYVISVTNQKGGVGKTTVSVNMAAGLALVEHRKNPSNPERILLVDMDSQCHAVQIVSGGIFSNNGGTQIPQDRQLAALLVSDTPYPAIESIVRAKIPTRLKNTNLDFIPSNGHAMVLAQKRLVGMDLFQFALIDALEQLEGMYKYVIIDTPPGPNTLLTNALFAATHILLPVQATGLGLAGFRETLGTIRSIRKPRGNPSLELLGVVPTMTMPNLESRTILDAIASECGSKQFIGEFGEQFKIFEPIGSRTEISVANTEGLDIFSLRKPRDSDALESASKAAREFAKFVQDVSDYFAKSVN